MCHTILRIPKLKRICQVTCLAFSNQAPTLVHAEATLSSEVMDKKPCICSGPKRLPLISDCLYFLFLASYTNHKGGKNQMKKRRFLPK